MRAVEEGLPACSVSGGIELRCEADILDRKFIVSGVSISSGQMCEDVGFMGFEER